MQYRLKNYQPIRRILDFANADFEQVWRSYCRRSWDADTPPATEIRSEVEGLHSRVRDLLQFLVDFTEWHVSQGVPPPGSPAEARLSLDLRLTIEEGHAKAKLATIEELRRLEEQYGGATDMLLDEEIHSVHVKFDHFHEGLGRIVQGVANRLFELHHCQREECGQLFIEDRRIADPSRRQRYCRKSCRQRANYERQKAEDPGYFRRAKRRSRERAKKDQDS